MGVQVPHGSSFQVVATFALGEDHENRKARDSWGPSAQGKGGKFVALSQFVVPFGNLAKPETSSMPSRSVSKARIPICLLVKAGADWHLFVQCLS